MPVVLKEGFKFDLLRSSQIPIGTGFEQELDGLPQRIAPVLYRSFF